MADVDIEVIRAFSDRVAASYEAAQAYAYCPSSEPYRNHMQKARAAKLHLDAVLDAAGVRACGSHECIAGQRDGVICANGECDRVNGVRPDGVRRGEMAALSRQPVAWRREFDGDVSDQGHWLYTEDEADTQDGYSWQPLFLQPPTEEELRAGLELFKRIATRGVKGEGNG